MELYGFIAIFLGKLFIAGFGIGCGLTYVTPERFRSTAFFTWIAFGIFLLLVGMGSLGSCSLSPGSCHLSSHDLVGLSQISGIVGLLFIPLFGPLVVGYLLGTLASWSFWQYRNS